MAKHKPLTPTKAEISWFDGSKLVIMALAQVILWVSMIAASVHVLLFWSYILLAKGAFDSTTVQYSVLVAVGAYFCLIVDKDKIYKALNIKTGLPFLENQTKSRVKP